MDSARLFLPAGVQRAWRDKGVTRSALNITAKNECLRHAWNSLYANTPVRTRPVTGVDNINVQDFKAEESQFIASISNKIRSGSFKFSPLKANFVPKGDGGIRVICVPTVSDRVVQKTLGNTLFDLGYSLNNSVNHGFVRKKSVKTAIKQVIRVRSNNPWAFKIDISSFFDKLDRALLIDKIKKEIKHRSLHEILVSAACLEILASRADEEKLYRLGIVKGCGVRQGMPLSPFFANLYLKEFDEFVERKQLPVVRYADDIIGFSDNEAQCLIAMGSCEDKLISIGLSLKKEKTILASPSQTVDFLGLGIARINKQYQPLVTNIQLERIKERIAQYSNLGFCARRNINLKNVLTRMDQLVLTYDMIYSEASNKNKVLDVVKSAKEKTIKDLFRKNFNLDYKNLTKDQRRFLGMSSLI
ncbi:reverse transcriptase domain-containing protein [Halomonas citrativorans]|uniref:Reverse transcriptase domain-containing protein n=1 Tax=Halomonas citrativorans TaxID=2742612 RepID=A0ABR9FAG5_9GAMM|nr:reverse transcriptase domain-containing protein [Halomonas citrativorans]MBE0403054.1 hypothetical protein [Halomonas citrativorans]